MHSDLDGRNRPGGICNKARKIDRGDETHRTQNNAKSRDDDLRTRRKTFGSNECRPAGFRWIHRELPVRDDEVNISQKMEGRVNPRDLGSTYFSLGCYEASAAALEATDSLEKCQRSIWSYRICQNFAGARVERVEEVSSECEVKRCEVSIRRNGLI